MFGGSAVMTGAGCKKCKPAEAALSERAPPAASAAGAGAGAAGSIGFMALAAPAIAAIAAGAAISYCGYVVYNHHKGIELENGEFSFNEKKVDMFLADDERYDLSINQTLGFN